MEEHIIFGTHHTEALRLIVYRAQRQGLQHQATLEPRDPRPGEPVTVKAWVGSDLSVRSLQCFYTADGSLPTLESASVSFRRVAEVWDSMVWGYRQGWEAQLPSQPEGVLVRYRIGGQRMDGGWVFADWPPAEDVIVAETRRFFGDPNAEAVLPAPEAGRTFAYHVDTTAPPAWAAEAVLYHIFVDRFAPGPGRAFTASADLSDFFGGRLAGITERLDYIAGLGINTLWLSPIFPSPTHHGYDVTDYRSVEPRLGTLDDLRALLDAAHARGVRVLLDIAFNHCSDQHPFFQAALADPESPYRAWFHFDPRYPGGYRGYFGVPTMPEWNLEHPATREYLIAAARFWLELGVDGFRLDYADGPGPTFWAEFCAAGRAVRPDAWFFGEIVQPPDILAPYVGRLDGSLDFLWSQQVRRAVAYGRMSADALARFWENHLATLTPQYLRPIFLDNHDMDRILLAADNDARRVRLALLLLCLWPHPPVLYYGTEIGLAQPHSSREEGYGLEVSRVPMEWNPARQDQTLLADVRRLLALRREQPGLIHGAQTTLYVGEALWVFARESGEARYVVALNLGETPADFPLAEGATPLWSTGQVRVDGAGAWLDGFAAAVWRV